VDVSLQNFIKLQKTLEGLPSRGGNLLFSYRIHSYSIVRVVVKLMYFIIFNVKGPNALEGIDYLQPFLDVIKSDEITSPITAMTLSSIHKFVQCGFLGSLLG
jgi:hypothetical protein